MPDMQPCVTGAVVLLCCHESCDLSKSATSRDLSSLLVVTDDAAIDMVDDYQCLPF